MKIVRVNDARWDLMRTVPMPFPGRYPTRVSVEVMVNTGRRDKQGIYVIKTFRYDGKPSKGVMTWLYSIRRSTGYISDKCKEWDRGGLIRTGGAGNPKLFKFYYPFGDPRYWWNIRFPKLVTWKKKSWVAYWTAEPTLQHGLEWKQWLEKVGVSWGS